MPTPTYTPLATVTLGSAVSSVTFSSIPATYRDLILVVNGSHSNQSYSRMRINGDTGSNYSAVDMKGNSNGATSATGTYTTIDIIWNEITSNSQYLSTVNLMDYSATDKHKTLLVRAKGTASNGGLSTFADSWRWANTAAITSLNLYASTGTYNVGSTFSLYGVIA
jgi:hypothetical protein